MLKLMNSLNTEELVRPTVGTFWNVDQYMDGIFVCEDGGRVGFSRFLLACYSPLLATTMHFNEEEAALVILQGFEMQTVSSFVRLLHGNLDAVVFRDKEKHVKELAHMLGIQMK